MSRKIDRQKNETYNRGDRGKSSGQTPDAGSTKSTGPNAGNPIPANAKQSPHNQQGAPEANKRGGKQSQNNRQAERPGNPTEGTGTSGQSSTDWAAGRNAQRIRFIRQSVREAIESQNAVQLAYLFNDHRAVTSQVMLAWVKEQQAEQKASIDRETRNVVAEECRVTIKHDPTGRRGDLGDGDIIARYKPIRSNDRHDDSTDLPNRGSGNE